MPIELENHTGWPAKLGHGFLDKDTKLAFVVTRCTFAWDPLTAHLSPTENVWPLFDRPLKTTHGVFAADRAAHRKGCEIVVSATATSERPVHSLDVRIALGRFERRLRVWGDRRWVGDGGALTSTTPEPFTAMTLGWDRAYGGSTTSEHRRSRCAHRTMERHAHAGRDRARGEFASVVRIRMDGGAQERQDPHRKRGSQGRWFVEHRERSSGDGYAAGRPWRSLGG
jgi:hypothetical protein